MNRRRRAARARRIAAWKRQLAAMERTLTRKARLEIAGTMRAAADAYEAGGPWEAALDLHDDRMAGLLTAHYNRTFEAFGSSLIRDIESATKAGGLNLDTKAARTRFWQSAANWIALNAANKVTRIAETTRAAIRSVLDRATQDGVGTDEAARRLRKGAIAASAYRAHMIARTETHQAANSARQIGADATGVEMTKEWVAVEDGRTRPDHADADDQRVPSQSAFRVGGVLLQHPGDPSGPPEQTINCRCTTAYIPTAYSEFFEGL